MEKPLRFKANLPWFYEPFDSDLDPEEFISYGDISVSGGKLNWTVPASTPLGYGELMVMADRRVPFRQGTVVVSSNGIIGSQAIRNGLTIYWDADNYIQGHCEGTIGKLLVVQGGVLNYYSGVNTFLTTQSVRLVHIFSTGQTYYQRYQGGWQTPTGYAVTRLMPQKTPRIIMGIISADGSNVGDLNYSSNYFCMTNFTYSTEYPVTLSTNRNFFLVKKGGKIITTNR